MTAARQTAAIAITRTAELREALTVRRRAVEVEVRERLKDGRSDGPNRARDLVDASDVNFQQAIDRGLLQMQAATLKLIDEALGRLDAGQYGSCGECSRPIAAGRLRALPFAVRCRTCEEEREQEDGRARQAAARGATPFSHVTS